MNFVRKSIQDIKGEEGKFDFRQRIFNISTFTFGLCFLLTGFFNWLLGGFGNLLLTCSVLFGLVYFTVFYFSRFKLIYFPWVFVVFTFAVGSIFWFITNGWRGAMPIVISLALVVCLTIVPRNQNLLTAVFLLALVGLGILESLFPNWVVPYPSENSYFVDVWITMIATILFISFVFQGFLKIYSEEREKLKQKNLELKEAQVQLVQSEKLASLGQLTAGIAHEINNPLNFVSSGVAILEASTLQLTELIKAYEELEKKHPAFFNANSQEAERIRNLKIQMELPETLSEIPHVIDDIENGESRIRTIVEGLQHFSHFDNNTLVAIDLNKCVRRVLVLYESRLKNSRLNCDFAPNLPYFKGNIGQIQQVAMSLLENASDACKENCTISISTKLVGDNICMQIQDSGVGMSEETLSKIFDPFFTTKPIGKGTGGLSISYGIIQQHNGKIEAESDLGVGSVFTVLFPAT